MGILNEAVKIALSAAVPRRLLMLRGPVTGGQAAAQDQLALYRPPQHTVALTYTGGPHPEYTRHLLDELVRFSMTATFFVTGQQAAAHVELIQRMDHDGHGLGIQVAAPKHAGEIETDELLEDVRNTHRVLQELTNRDCQIVRPPRGQSNFRTLIELWQDGRTVVMWSVDSGDDSIVASEQLQDWCRRYRPADGDIVLFHDHYPHAVHTLEILALMRVECGLRFVSVGDWVPALQPAQQH